MTLYQKVLSVFAVLRDSIAKKSDQSNIAEEFSPDSQYKEGDVVMHGGELYVCTSSHTGEWNRNSFSRTTVADRISSMSDVFDGIDLADGATQNETRIAVQRILAALKSMACFAAMSAEAFSFGATLTDTTEWGDVSPTNIVKNVVERFSPPEDFSTNNATLVESIRSVEDFSTNNAILVESIRSVAGDSSRKRIAMFILPVNDLLNPLYIDEFGMIHSWTGFDLKCSTNNFSSYVYGSNTSYIENPVGDGARVFVPNNTGLSDDSSASSYTPEMTLTNITNVSSEDMALILSDTRTAVVLVSPDNCRNTDGSWLHSDNEELSWIWLRTDIDNVERYLGPNMGGALWRQVQPVKWLSALPAWDK